MSEERDRELRASIKANKAEKAKYERVRKAIEKHDLDTQQDLTSTNDFITKCQNALDKLNSNAGYGYLSNFKDKLTTDLSNAKKYRDYVKDANTAFMNLHSTVVSKISSLDKAIERDREEYDSSRSIFETAFDDY